MQLDLPVSGPRSLIQQLGHERDHAQLADEAATFARRAETESLRNSLLNAISHDLRTPLAVLVGASSSLVDQAGRLSDAARRDLAMTMKRYCRP